MIHVYILNGLVSILSVTQQRYVSKDVTPLCIMESFIFQFLFIYNT